MEQQHKSHCRVAANDADSAEKIKIFKAHEINGNPEKDMSIHNPKKSDFIPVREEKI